MWDSLSKPWKACFEEAWDSYCHGSIPIGAVLVDANGEIISRGRNRIHENSAPHKQVCSNRLAHAELNVILQLEQMDSQSLRDYILYTTTEPCVLCFGAIVMSGIRTVRYAASDPIAGGVSLNQSEHAFIKSRKINIRKDEQILGDIQRVLRTDYVLRTMSKDKQERFLNAYCIEYPDAVNLGRSWFESGKLAKAKKDKLSIDFIINEISNGLRAIRSIHLSNFFS